MQPLDEPLSDGFEEAAEAQIGIMEKSSTIVAKSIDCRASCVPDVPKATMRTAPMMAAPGRSIFIHGNLPSANTK